MNIIMSITTTIIIISPYYPAYVILSLLFPQPSLLSTSLLKSIFLEDSLKEKIVNLKSISLFVCVSRRSPCSVCWDGVLGTELCVVRGPHESLRLTSSDRDSHRTIPEQAAKVVLPFHLFSLFSLFIIFPFHIPIFNIDF